MSEKIKINQTGRGFNRADFEDGNGEKCSIQESSALRDEGLIWLGLNPMAQSRRMHLTQSQVRALLPILQHFAETGCLPCGEED